MTPSGEAAGGRPAVATPREPSTGDPAQAARDAARTPGTAGPAVTARPAGAPGPAAPSRRARIEGLLLGLAAGDAAGWPAARHRAARMPEWTRRLTRELDTFAEQNATTTLPVPIALNQPPEPLRLGPSDDAEWAAFAARTVLAAAADEADGLSPGRRMRDAVDRAWNALAATVAAASARAPEVEAAVLPLRARISVRAGLGNLAAGLRPPPPGTTTRTTSTTPPAYGQPSSPWSTRATPRKRRGSPSSTPATPRTATGCTEHGPWPPPSPWRWPGRTSTPW